MQLNWYALSAFIAVAIVGSLIAWAFARGLSKQRKGPGDEEEDTTPDAALMQVLSAEQRHVILGSAVPPRDDQPSKSGVFPSAYYAGMHVERQRSALLSGLVDRACMELYRVGRQELATELRVKCLEICAQGERKVGAA